MPELKEPGFFANDYPNFPVLHKTTRVEEYLTLFEKAEDRHIAIGEATSRYLSSNCAVKNIYDFNKKAKIIIMIRNPLDMAYSCYRHLVCQCYEEKKDFESAWYSQDERKRIPSLTRRCPTPAFLQYRDSAKVGDQIERVFRIFSKDQVKIIVFDDFVDKTEEQYRNVLSFLNVPYDGRKDFPAMNASRVHRIRWLSYLIMPLVTRVKLSKLAGSQNYGIRSRQFRLLRIFQVFNLKKSKRKPLSEEFKATVCKELKSDVEKLSSLINKDLTYWLR